MMRFPVTGRSRSASSSSYNQRDLLVPRNDLDVLQVFLELQDLLPSVIPQGLTQKDPVLGIRDLLSEVGVDCVRSALNLPSSEQLFNLHQGETGAM